MARFSFAVTSIGTLLMIAATAGCPVMPPADVAATPDAEDLVRKIMVEDPYTQWDQFPEARGTVASSPPHGPLARILINDAVAAAVRSSDGSLPDGAIVLKENLADGGAATDKTGTLTVMWKVRGFDPDNNDWFWAKIRPDGKVEAAGRLQTCIGCHSAARDNDFIFTHRF